MPVPELHRKSFDQIYKSHSSALYISKHQKTVMEVYIFSRLKDFYWEE